MLISVSVVPLALPFTNGVACSLPNAQSHTAALSLSTFTSEVPLCGQ